MLMLFWMLLGGAIGAAAAQKKGFSVVGGVVGGAVLGPLAVLMFAVSGVVSSKERRKCPFCAEWVQPEATVCKHCRKELPASPDQRSCPFCGGAVGPNAALCKHCHRDLPASAA